MKMQFTKQAVKKPETAGRNTANVLDTQLMWRLLNLTIYYFEGSSEYSNIQKCQFSNDYIIAYAIFF